MFQIIFVYLQGPIRRNMLIIEIEGLPSIYFWGEIHFNIYSKFEHVYVGKKQRDHKIRASQFTETIGDMIRILRHPRIRIGQ